MGEGWRDRERTFSFACMKARAADSSSTWFLLREVAGDEEWEFAGASRLLIAGSGWSEQRRREEMRVRSFIAMDCLAE